MPQPQHSAIQLAIPLSILVGAINQWPTEALLQLLHAAEATLATRAEFRPEGQLLPGEDAQFWESGLGQYIAAKADDSITIADVRQALSVIPDSLAAKISKERDER
jgi:hypothetical protein